MGALKCFCNRLLRPLIGESRKSIGGSGKGLGLEGVFFVKSGGRKDSALASALPGIAVELRLLDGRRLSWVKTILIKDVAPFYGLVFASDFELLTH